MKAMLRRALVGALLLALLCAALVACDSDYRNDLASSEVMASVKATLPAGDGYRVAGDGFINASDWGADYQKLIDMLIDRQILLSESSDTNIDEVGILRCKDAKCADDARAIVEDYLAAKQLRMKPLLESYNPNEIPKLDNIRVTVCGSYILYTVLSSAETGEAHDAFKGALAE